MTVNYLGLRALRLWHWRSMVKARELAQRTPSGGMSERYSKEADTHLAFVQTLNDHFPQGDTAERDAQP